MNIAFFGSSLLSAYWNGAATYYRGILRALHERGHDITFYAPDAWERQSHRDIDPPPYARSVVYAAGHAGDALRAVKAASWDANLIVKASGVGVFDQLLEEAVLTLRSNGTLAAFWDVDAAATLDRMTADPQDLLRRLIPDFDIVFTYGGGEPVVNAYRELGAKRCVPIYITLSTRQPISALHPTQDSRQASPFSATVCRIERSGYRNSFLILPAPTRNWTCCSAAAAGTA
jgi:spore maturation protein CgeB